MLFKKNKALLELGFYNDQDGILERFYREGNGWTSHIENTKYYILKSALKHSKKSVAILGSGWLLDVPLKELSSVFSEVHLFDVIHPQEIKQKVKRYSNVKCIEQDLTGGFINAIYEQFCNNKNENKIPLSDLSNIQPLFTTNYDYVVSVNILNQLDILLVDYLRQYEIYSDEELNDFRNLIQKKHFEFLPKGKSCLITDYEELIYEKEQLLETKPLIFTVIPEGSDKEQWQWNFDSSGAYNKDKKTIFNVMAFNL